ncbi:hypothetical protein [Rhodococcus olei]|uniref:hypothetical protein n=1 Tax=Rhodococcus olei TaxID=2161675 RepID=UPI0031ECF472
MSDRGRFPQRHFHSPQKVDDVVVGESGQRGAEQASDGGVEHLEVVFHLIDFAIVRTMVARSARVRAFARSIDLVRPMSRTPWPPSVRNRSLRMWRETPPNDSVLHHARGVDSRPPGVVEGREELAWAIGRPVPCAALGG